MKVPQPGNIAKISTIGNYVPVCEYAKKSESIDFC
jgi:hypothetical protein